ncbi:putative F0F1-ATPase subunit (Ca2+/Mg2+ transporter) [Mumia flava]|uniref:Putative F0F1-ATPase subunit (Ca2+/Mg2+ transporter) n=1 Tax=Mumia flava TaxID=1348852 RepID=A0A0B2BTB1_9ACTN|nr:AtpZ/AtpI family protein [Mumia flava]PJJ56454.1 putative F0F1-ATPase subunit (Ca2+/Mg2+ transporter) [Mumia flava]
MSTNPPTPSTDPWVAVGRISGGVLVYGAIGYLLDRWWETSFMVAIGVIVGAALGIYTVVATTRHPS